MGKPPMGLEETKVRLPIGTKARIIALVGGHKMADFIRDAVKAELERREAGQRRPKS